MPNDFMHWSYQHPDHLTLDDFENNNTALNTAGGSVSFPGSLTVTEGSIGSCSFHPFTNGTGGVTWVGAGDIYESDVPAADKDVSAYSHLSFRVTQVPDGGVLNPVDTDKTLIVRLVDGDGDSRKALTVDFRDIPYPYERSATNRPCEMKNVRIPLRTFAMNNSGVDLDDIDRVEIEFPGTGKVAIDEVQFTQ